MLEAVKELKREYYQTSLSRSLNISPDLWVNNNVSFYINLSGSEVLSVSGGELIPLEPEYHGTYYAGTLSGVETGQILEEFTDYEIADYNKLLIYDVENLETDVKYPNHKYVNLYSEQISKISDVVFNLFRKMTGIESVHIQQTYYWPFTYSGVNDPGYEQIKSYRDEKAVLLKYMSWALLYLKKKMPTLDTIQWIYNILFNMPFAYEEGNITITDNVATLGSHTYYKHDNDVWAFSTGQTVEKFEPLCSGITVDDWITDPTLISNTFESGQEKSGMVITVSSCEYSSRIDDLINDFNDNFLGKNFNYAFSGVTLTDPGTVDY
jgi:hypothetical protein